MDEVKKLCDKPVLFIITSVIYYTNAPLCYTDIRSIFCPEERAKQTVWTIESIRARFSKAKILLIESGLNNELPCNIANLVDCYLYNGTDTAVRAAVDSKFKGLGEAISLIQTAPYLIYETTPFVMKLSGRYFLSEDFNFNNWNLQKFNALICEGAISTRLYGFSQNEYPMWLNALKQAIPLLVAGVSIEDALYQNIAKDKFNSLKKLGVSGLVGVDASLIKE
ncbi:MAG: hypothetical protein H6Q73_3224 [Firmicutes bacterium]|nr:hypothetical protein [Bacillota bacterium]